MPLLEETENQDEISFKWPRVESLTEEAQYNWGTPDELKKYAEKYFERFVQEKDLKETVFIASFLPTNQLRTRKLEKYFHELLEEQRRKKNLVLDDAFQEKNTEYHRTNKENVVQN